MPISKHFLLLYIPLFLLAHNHAFSCEVPVFSYAMQHWSADPYRVYIFHEGNLSDEQTQRIEQFQAVASHETLETNITVEVFDMNALKDASLIQLRETYLGDISTGVVVLYPTATRIPRPVYVGPLSATLLGDLVDSPARRTLAGDLLAGKVAVWVLLESGNRRADNAAFDMLEKELRRMEEVLQLPSIELWAWSDRLHDAAEAGKGVRFSIIRVSRDALEEAPLIQMLLQSEPDLVERADAPQAFPVYGRGLVLYALVGAGINEWTISEACDFIVGPCSCQVKASNPGTDILMSVNWSQHIRKTSYDQAAPLAGFSDFFERGDALAAQLAEDDAAAVAALDVLTARAPDSEEMAGTSSRWIAVAVVVFCAVLGLFFYVSYRQTFHKEMN